MPTIINGHSIGKLGNQWYSDETKELVYAVKTGNAIDLQNRHNLNAVLGSQMREVERIDGQYIPVERFNIFFTKGGVSTDVIEFNKDYDNFVLKESEGFNALEFEHSLDEVLKARNAKIDLAKQDAERVEGINRVYMQKYLPNTKLVTIITGHSFKAKIPTEATKGSDDNYVRSVGWLRGEKITDFVDSTVVDTHASHYLGTKEATLSVNDIFGCVDLIERYETYSGKGVMAIINPRILTNLGMLYKDTMNQDNMVINGVTLNNFMGINWLPFANMSKDFIIFLDAGDAERIFRCVNPDPEQRGIGIVTKKNLETFKKMEDLDGAKLRIFEEEYMMFHRERGCILCISEKGKTDTGKEGWMSDAGVTKLEAYTQRLINGYYRG